MSYTLKIKWTRYEKAPDQHAELADETTLFIPADEVRVHGLIEANARRAKMASWDENNAPYFNYLSCFTTLHGEDVSVEEDGGRLIQVIHNDDHAWYLATQAWVLGSDGKTIERVAP